MDLLGEYHAEQAAMSGGVVDGVERLQKLRDQLDLTDPDYAFDVVSVRPGHTELAVRPKDPLAAERRPLGGLLSFTVAKGSPMERAIDDFMHYGRPVTIPCDNVTAVDLDLPGGLGDLIAPGSRPEVRLGQSGGDPGWRQLARLVAVHDGRVLATLPIEWDDRSHGPRGGQWLGGRDRSGFLGITMQVGPDLLGGFTMTAPASDDVLPTEVLPALRFLQAARQANRIRLEIPGKPSQEVRVTGDLVGEPDIAGSLMMAEALARIQDAVGTTFPLPRRWSRKDAEYVYFYDQILHNGSVIWHWPGAQIPVLAGSVAPILTQGLMPRLSMTGGPSPNPAVALFGHPFALPGALHMKITDVLLLNAPALTVRIQAVPPWVPVLADLGVDDRTLCTFTLDDPTDETPVGGTSGSD